MQTGTFPYLISDSLTASLSTQWLLANERHPGQFLNAGRAPADQKEAHMSHDPQLRGEPYREPGQFTVAIKCHWCGRQGILQWEEAGGEHQLVSLDGFYERVASKEPFPIERVCNGC